jgi:2-polyprenyl-6-methoxyphenol hydroxylase-like FAD-dependent oxidoreductase
LTVSKFKLAQERAVGHTFFLCAYNFIHMKTDVLVVGAGPTGLALAVQLIRNGIDFVIIDKTETITPYSKAIGVQARTLEIYDQIGLADAAVRQGTIGEKIRMFAGGELRAEFDFGNIGEGMSPFPFVLMLEQSKNETLLYDYIRTSGQDVVWSTELENLKQDADGVTASVKHVDGTRDEINAKYMVGCDGPRSLTRHLLGLEFEGSTFERVFYVADAQIDWQMDHNALQICLAEESFVIFFPLKGDKRWRIVGTFPDEFSKDTDEILYEEIEQRIKEQAEIELDIHDVEWFSTYKVHSRHVEKFSSGRCFLAGDSAHVHTPVGAQGMNTGIQDGYNLAWKLAMTLRGEAGDKLLDTYNDERLANAKNLLRTTDRMFHLAADDDWYIAFLRVHVLPFVAGTLLGFDSIKRLLFPLVSQIGINYRKSRLSVGDDFKIKAGDRMPYFEIDGASIYDRLRDPKFHLLIFSDGASVIESDSVAMDYAAFDVLPLYPGIAETFGTNETLSVILRPDNYIGYIAKGLDEGVIKKYLLETIGLIPPISK